MMGSIEPIATPKTVACGLIRFTYMHDLVLRNPSSLSSDNLSGMMDTLDGPDGSILVDSALTMFVRCDNIEYIDLLMNKFSIDRDELDLILFNVRSIKVLNKLIEYGATAIGNSLYNAVMINNLPLVRYCMKLGAGGLKEDVIHSIERGKRNINVVEFTIGVGEIALDEVVDVAMKYENIYIVSKLMKRGRFSQGRMRELLKRCESMEVKNASLNTMRAIIAVKDQLNNEDSLLFNLPWTIIEVLVEML